MFHRPPVSILALLAIMLCAFVGAAGCSKKPKTVQAPVELVSWERTLIIESRFIDTKEGWRTELPDDAYDLSCLPRKAGTRKCNAHPCIEFSLRNGPEISTCYDTCDVMKDWCAYHQDRWQETCRSPTIGFGTVGAWPNDLQAETDDERLIRFENYVVVFAKRTGIWPRYFMYQTVEPEDYARFLPGEYWEIETRAGMPVVPKRIARAEQE